MPRVGLATDELFLGHEQPGHPERPARLHAILDHLAATALRERLVGLPPRDATDAERLAVHEASIIEEQQRIAKRGGGYADPDTYIRPDSPAAARRAAGAVLASVDAVLDGTLDRAFAAVRPPGHHATADRLMGFCLLNSVAIAAAAALARGIERVAIVDWDVHHGNGTQDIFETEPRVLYISTHAAPFYPGSGHLTETGVGAGIGSTINIPLPLGSGDRALGAAFEEVVVPALDRFEPQLLLVSSGWDAHARDPLGPLNVSTAGYTEAARRTIEAADRLCDGRIVVALEGGYDEHALAWCASALCELLLGEEPTPDPEPVPPVAEPDVAEILAAVRRAASLD